MHSNDTNGYEYWKEKLQILDLNNSSGLPIQSPRLTFNMFSVAEIFTVSYLTYFYVRVEREGLHGKAKPGIIYQMMEEYYLL